MKLFFLSFRDLIDFEFLFTHLNKIIIQNQIKLLVLRRKAPIEDLISYFSHQSWYLIMLALHT